MPSKRGHKEYFITIETSSRLRLTCDTKAFMLCQFYVAAKGTNKTKLLASFLLDLQLVYKVTNIFNILNDMVIDQQQLMTITTTNYLLQN